jgi:hypothetical protein
MPQVSTSCEAGPGTRMIYCFIILICHHPCNLLGELVPFMRGGGDGKDLDNKRFTALCPCTKCSPTFLLQLFEVVVVRREKLLG